MHPVENIRGSASEHLAGKRIVLAVSGSIAAVKTVELARELVRHGAQVHAVMSDAATRIIHPEALHFATGNPVTTKLTGAVEHVSLLGDVPGRADLLLMAPVTSNTIAKLAVGIDDTPVTTCGLVAIGTGVPVVIAPAMHEAMLDHPSILGHVQTLRHEHGVEWVDPHREEHKAKLADPEVIVEAVIRRLAKGPMAGKRCLVITGSTEERVDDVRIITNRSSGRTGHVLAQTLGRLGAQVDVWQGRVTQPTPAGLRVRSFSSHADLMAMAGGDLSHYDQIWMPAAVGDYAPDAAAGKIASGQSDITLHLHPLGKVIDRVRRNAPKATLVAFKAEASQDGLVAKARERMGRYGAQYVVANTAAAFDAEETKATLVCADGTADTYKGSKAKVFADIIQVVAEKKVAKPRPSAGDDDAPLPTADLP